MKKNNTPGRSHSKTSGFTLAEAVVSLSILSLFLVLFFQAYQSIAMQQVLYQKRVIADEIASTNLRKFTKRPLINNITSLTCAPSSPMDIGGAGLLIGDSSSTSPLLNSWYGFTPEDVSKLPDSVQKIYVFASQGCTEFDNLPVKIVSEVTYGNPSVSVVHGAYVK